METSFLSEPQKTFVNKVESFHKDIQENIDRVKKLSEQLRGAIDELNSCVSKARSICQNVDVPKEDFYGMFDTAKDAVREFDLISIDEKCVRDTYKIDDSADEASSMAKSIYLTFIDCIYCYINMADENQNNLADTEVKKAI